MNEKLLTIGGGGGVITKRSNLSGVIRSSFGEPLVALRNERIHSDCLCGVCVCATSAMDTLLSLVKVHIVKTSTNHLHQCFIDI